MSCFVTYTLKCGKKPNDFPLGAYLMLDGLLVDDDRGEEQLWAAIIVVVCMYVCREELVATVPWLVVGANQTMSAKK
jgi:hypothetical protein